MADQQAAGLDGLRGVSALIVAAAHAAVLPLAGGWPLLQLGFGLAARAAVLIFFVLSGHVIAASILRMRRSGGFSPLAYAVNRIARVYPPFLLCVALAWTVALLRANGAIPPQPALMAEPLDVSLLSFLRDVAFLFGSGTPVQNANAPVWSLRIEVVCYIAAGLIAAALTAAAPLRLALLAAAVLLAAAATYKLHDAALGMAAFALGAATALRPWRLPRGIAPLSWAAAVALCTLTLWAASTAPAAGVAGMPAYRAAEAAFMLAAAATILRLTDSEKRLSATLVGRLAPLAPFSYTLFITHVPLIILAGGLIPTAGPLPVRLVTILVVTAALAGLAFVLAKGVERQSDIRRFILARLKTGGA